MKLTKLTFLSTIFLGFVLLASPFFVMAQTVVTDGDLTATFSDSPLFTSPDTSDLAPGNAVSGTINIENNSTVTETILFSVENETDNGLASGVELIISESGTELYKDTFSDFFVDSPITVDTIDAGDNKTYTMTATFLTGSDDTYQGTGMSFDLLVGFASGSIVTPPTPTGDGDGSGGTLITPSPGESNLPPGQTAGAFDGEEPSVLGIDDLFNEFFDRFVPSFTEVETDTRSETDSTESTETSESDTDPGTLVTTDQDKEENYNCTFWWLVILGLLLLIGTLANHSFRPKNAVMTSGTKVSILFALSFVVLVWIAWYMAVLASVWWVLALAWFVYFGYEHLHLLETETLWNKPFYYTFYIGIGAILVGTSWIWNIPCEWWPFVGVSLFTAVLGIHEYLTNRF